MNSPIFRQFKVLQWALCCVPCVPDPESFTGRSPQMRGAKQRGFQTKGCDTRHVVVLLRKATGVFFILDKFERDWHDCFLFPFSKGHSEILEISGPRKFSRKNARSGLVLVFRGCSQSNKRIMAGLFQILPAVYNQTWQ